MMRMWLLLLTVILIPRPAAGQEIQFETVADLMLGTDSLTPGETIEVARNGRGGWFVAGLQLSYKWAEFGPDGELVRAPGREWSSGGPGEFRDIEFVLPLRGDTILVVDRSRLVWALRDGTYIGQEILPFRVREYTVHSGRIWLVGSSHRTLALWSLDASGKPDRKLRFPVSEQPQPSAYPVSVGGALWLWEYPRGPLHRLDEISGGILESWNPFSGRTDTDWRAFARPGPGRTLLFDFVDLRRSPPIVPIVMTVDADRNVTEWGRRRDERRNGKFFTAGFAWGPIHVQDPIELWAGVRIFEVTLPGEGDRSFF